MGSDELYDLFLALALPRIEGARTALTKDTEDARREGLEAALVPLAVDATLLGAEGVKAVAMAIVKAHAAADDELEKALDGLERAADALGDHDESGARVNESELRAEAELLMKLAGETEATAPETTVDASLSSDGDYSDDSVWVPTLAEDMISAFLDESVERLDGLSERLLELEARSDDKELVNEVFRDLHTLKGSSAFAGLKKMNRVAHLAEDLIGELRDDKRSCDRALIDILLETLDVLRAITERARARAAIDVEVGDLLRRLQDPSRAKAPAGPSPQKAERKTEGTKPAAPAKPAPPAAARASQATLRIDFAKIDLLLNLVGEVVLARGRLNAAAENQSALLREISQLRKRIAGVLGGGALKDRELQLVDDLQRTERVLQETYGDLDGGLGVLGLAVGQLRDNVMKLRMVPISRLFTKYQRTVRELSNKLGKEVQVELVGAETELDKVLVERLEDPLLHLVRNSVDHGVEKPERREAAGKPRVGTVRLIASQSGGQIIVTIEDDGAGMNPQKLEQKALEKGIITSEEAEGLSDSERFALIFRAGFSTAAQVSDVSGRGVGMDVVRTAIDKLKGTIHLESELGQGTRLELRLPLTLAITQVLAARVGGELVAIPLDAVVSAQTITADELEVVGDGVCLRVGDELVPVVELSRVLGLQGDAIIGEVSERAVVIVQVGHEQLGLEVQQVLGRHEVVIKSLGPLLSGTPCAAGATLVGDRVLLVADLNEVGARAKEPLRNTTTPRRRPTQARRRARLLIAEDSDTIRETLRRELAAAGFDVETAPDGEIAWEIAQRSSFDAIATDVLMPRMDGYQLARKLRGHERYERAPIVMVTSKDARLDSMRGYDAGADAYLTKPFDVSELVRTLDGLLSSR